jgi:hypothetical protein
MCDDFYERRTQEIYSSTIMVRNGTADRVLYGKMMGMSQKTARGKIPVSVMHLAQRFYKTVNDMPAAKGRDVLDSSKELSIPLQIMWSHKIYARLPLFSTRIWTSSKSGM